MSGLHAAIVALALTGAGVEQPVLLDFSASWCKPCRSMEPVIDELIAKGYRVRKLDFDRDRELARKYQVSKIPCFVMLAGGRETARILGATPIGRLEAMFAEARSQMPVGPLPEPNRLPDQPGVRPMPSPGPIPLPKSHSPSALAMESPPSVPTNPDSRTPAPEIPAQPVSFSPSRGPQPPGVIPSGIQDKDLIAATVRLRVHDAQGPSIGTGTIIDARGGKALILTCGHIFREYREGGLIEVELFNSPESQSVEGRLLSFDDKRDVGLLMIDAPGPLQTVKVAPKGYSVDVGATVVNLGCNHGDPPLGAPQPGDRAGQVLGTAEHRGRRTARPGTQRRRIVLERRACDRRLQCGRSRGQRGALRRPAVDPSATRRRRPLVRLRRPAAARRRTGAAQRGGPGADGRRGRSRDVANQTGARPHHPRNRQSRGGFRRGALRSCCAACA